jgi:threonine synthase
MQPWERQLRCGRCGRTSGPDAGWRCSCGGSFDLEGGTVSFPFGAIGDRPFTLWRYAEALPFAPDAPEPRRLTMGEGGTALIELQAGAGLVAKVELANPTLSFKDRGAVMLVARALALGVSRLVADSSGNAGTAVAAYAARAGLACTVYVAESASPGKVAQMRVYGADVRGVAGSRQDVADAAVADVEASGAHYASHVHDPFFVEGTKTFAFEVCEQLGWRAPDTLVLPAGNGTLVLGVHRGFRQLVDAGVVDRLPRIVAVQAAGCAPIAAAFAAGRDHVDGVAGGTTIAEGVAIARPQRGDQILAAVRATGGQVVAVDDDAIVDARARLAAEGIDVEPTGALPLAGALALPPDDTDGPIVVPLGGAGLKARR